MSDPNTSQDQPTPPASTVPTDQAETVTPAVPEMSKPAAATTAKKQHVDAAPRLSVFLKVSIALLAGLTIASISLLFIGDFEGKFERIFSTFALFAVFVVFTAIDTRRGQKSEWYAPVALIANAYILGLLLIVIWMTSYDSFGLMFEIFWKSVFVIVVTRLVIICCQLLLKTGNNLPETVSRFAFITSILAVLSGILFTAPLGIEAFDLTVPDVYWKIATALLILTALGLSITLLLRWSYGASEREAARNADAAQRARQVYPGQIQAGDPYMAQAHQAPQAPQAPQAYPAPQASTAPPRQAAPVQAQAAPLLPWPRFADGTPLPALADGQPDFSVPGAPLQ